MGERSRIGYLFVTILVTMGVILGTLGGGIAGYAVAVYLRPPAMKRP